ncbi:MAG: nickel pincer cofactor biosynthesis protein LarC [Lachnospiraceae bacterium]|nr:nickel pincer cofactor biosynthesis protein LarC [Lachnospiraceae bacterium]
MSKTLYLECCSGISGDMMTAALLDLGADVEVLRKALKSLPVDGYEIKISRVKKAGLDVCDFDVVLDAAHENHDHDMEYLYGHQKEQREGHGHGHVSHEHRSLADILKLIEMGDLTPRAKQTASDIFCILGEAEARAHGVPGDQVHFHEVGAVDSIVDIVSAAVCLDNLEITDVIVEELYEGRGTIRCQHGILPIPVPAVVNIAQKHHLNLRITDVEGELVTPTGAAIAAAIRTKERLPEHFSIQRVGMGAGKRSYACAGILRAMLICGEEQGMYLRDFVCRLETNIDDCSGEMLGFLMERLMEAGAKDVSYTPIYMKKNRPAYQVTVICRDEDADRMEDIIFEETTTIGIRKIKMERSILKRDIRTISTEFGEMKVKVCELPSGERIYPEYEEAVKICRKYGISYYEVCRRIRR